MLIDITRPIHPGMAIYPGNPPVSFEKAATASEQSSALTNITLGSHTGTHIDAPSHIIEGAKGTASYMLDRMIGKAEVVEFPPLPATSAPRVLIKTSNSSKDPNAFDPDFIALSESDAEELVKRGVKLVGIDAPSIKKKNVRDKTHAILLDAGIIILEGLWLKDVAPGAYELLCLPLSVNLDGAPVRAVLR